jgi:hypothetical protein
VVLSREEKLKYTDSLNRDYTAGPFDQKTLLARSLERFHWEYVVALWGVEK